MKPIDETKPYESRLLEDLHLTLQNAYTASESIFNERHNDVHVIRVCTYRNNAMQTLYYKKKPKITNAKASESPHNYYPSFAFDIAFVKVGKKELDYSPKLFKEFNEIIQGVSSNVVWGYDWNGNKIKDKNDFDMPHFELKGWKQLIV